MKTLVVLFGSLLSLVSQPEKSTISLQVKDIRSNKGELTVAIYRPGDDFLSEDAYRLLRVKASSSGAETKIELPEGRYAIAVYHDENNNRDLDKNFIGVPKEAVGISNSKGSGLVRPVFANAAFDLNRDTKLVIDLIHY